MKQPVKYVKVDTRPDTWIQCDINTPDSVIIARYRERLGIVEPEKPVRKYRKINIRKSD